MCSAFAEVLPMGQWRNSHIQCEETNVYKGAGLFGDPEGKFFYEENDDCPHPSPRPPLGTGKGL